MKIYKILQKCFLLSALVIAVQPLPRSFAQENQTNTSTPAAGDAESKKRDGRRDFDAHIGVWKTKLKRLVKPLSNSNAWVEYEGRTVVRKVWDGRANLVELTADSPAGRFEGLSLRLYNPESRQWSLNFASVKGGTMAVPTIGEFKDGRGEFYNQETFNGRAILVRFIITSLTPDSFRFEQSFSDDGGKTWETNWIATDTRVKNETAQDALKTDEATEIENEAERAAFPNSR